MVREESRPSRSATDDALGGIIRQESRVVGPCIECIRYSERKVVHAHPVPSRDVVNTRDGFSLPVSLCRLPGAPRKRANASPMWTRVIWLVRSSAVLSASERSSGASVAAIRRRCWSGRRCPLSPSAATSRSACRLVRPYCCGGTRGIVLPVWPLLAVENVLCGDEYQAGAVMQAQPHDLCSAVDVHSPGSLRVALSRAHVRHGRQMHYHLGPTGQKHSPSVPPHPGVRAGATSCRRLPAAEKGTWRRPRSPAYR